MKSDFVLILIILALLQFSFGALADSQAPRLPIANSAGQPINYQQTTKIPTLSLIQAATMAEVIQYLSRPNNRLIWICGQDVVRKIQNLQDTRKLAPECRSELNRILTKDFESDSREIVGLATKITAEKYSSQEKLEAIYNWITRNIALDV